MAFAGELGKTLALALARRLARGLRQPVVVLTARLSKEGPGDSFECEVDDLTVLRDGASARLDEIAKQVRLADRSTFASIGGRCCVRITTAGATVTSFLEPPEVEALRRALAVVEGAP